MNLTKSEVYSYIPKDLVIKLSLGFDLQFIGGIHGFEHWVRVIENGIDISNNIGTSRRIAVIFGFFHDIERLHDGDDPLHGLRGGKLLEHYRDDLKLTDEDFKNAYLACEGHNYKKNTENKEVGACWDSDRLDLFRDNLVPRAEFMNSDYTRSAYTILEAMGRSQRLHFPQWAKEVLEDINRVKKNKLIKETCKTK